MRRCLRVGKVEREKRSDDDGRLHLGAVLPVCTSVVRSCLSLLCCSQQWDDCSRYSGAVGLATKVVYIEDSIRRGYIVSWSTFLSDAVLCSLRERCYFCGKEICRLSDGLNAVEREVGKKCNYFCPLEILFQRFGSFEISSENPLFENFFLA